LEDQIKIKQKKIYNLKELFETNEQAFIKVNGLQP